MAATFTHSSRDTLSLSLHGNIRSLPVLFHLIIRFYPVQTGCSELSIRLRPDLTGYPQPGYCYCSSYNDVTCKGLTGVPYFLSHKAPNDPNPLDDPQDPNGLVRIGSLYASRQFITSIPQGAFRSMLVQRIVLNFNSLGGNISSGALSGLESVLEEFQLGACGIGYLPEGLLYGMKRLRYLHLWANKITSIPAGYFKEAENLRELILWGNDITELGHSTFAGLWNLRKLDLGRNRISGVSREYFRHLLELGSLNLSGNRIRALDGDTFSYMGNLKALNLDHNQIEFIYPEAFNGLQNLLSLSLNGNRISFVPQDVFTTLHNLTTLSLNHNHIDYVWRKTFSGLRSLQRLHLCHNRLKNLPEGAFRHSLRLRHLYMDDNELTVLSRCVLASQTRPNVVSLIQNPVRCGCEVDWLREAQTSASHGDRATVVWGTCLVDNVTSLKKRYDVRALPGYESDVVTVSGYAQMMLSCDDKSSSHCIYDM